MSEIRTVKLIKSGNSQTVRLPDDFRFAGDEVYVTRDGVTGDLVLSAQPGAAAWASFFELLHSLDVPDDFRADRELNAVPRERDVFDEQDGSDEAGGKALRCQQG